MRSRVKKLKRSIKRSSKKYPKKMKGIWDAVRGLGYRSLHSVAMNTTPKPPDNRVDVLKFLLQCSMIGIVISMRARAGGNIWVRLHILLIKQMRKICVKKKGVILPSIREIEMRGRTGLVAV